MANNYTDIIPNVDANKTNMMTAKDLHAIDFKFSGPFILPLAQDQVLFAEQIIRLMPRKRLVAFGTWLNKPVVAKIFFDSYHAKRHMEEDARGIQILRDNKVPTPALYYQGMSADRRVYVLLFERIYEAKSLETVWQEKRPSENLFSLFKHVVVELATQHVLGILQKDLHLKNFLLTKKRIYTLDGGQIEQHPHLLPKKNSMNNLALLLSQLGIGVSELQEKLFNHYAKARGWLLKTEDVSELFSLIKKWDIERWLHYEKKIFRESTNFACHKDFGTFILYDRSYAQPEFIAFLANPESVFTDAKAIPLKTGRSSTVIKIKLDNRDYVIKRYNIKNSWHFIRRALRATRASFNWRVAQKLKFFHVATAKPIAFIENRFLGLRTTSYYITEYVSGVHLGDYLSHVQNDSEKIADMIKKVSQLFTLLYQLKMTHGDLKITNILIDNEAQPVLIDLDGTTEHQSSASLAYAYKKDMTRFLKNFAEQQALQQQFHAELHIK